MKVCAIILSVICLCVSLPATAQQKTPEQIDKEFYENLDRQIEKYTDMLSLSDSQVFYTDSILTHNYSAMRKELEGMQKSKVSSPDLYVMVQDKWAEATYNAFGKILDEQQWAKYLKSGAAREKKARDKREAKRNK